MKPLMLNSTGIDLNIKLDVVFTVMVLQNLIMILVMSTHLDSFKGFLSSEK